MSVIVKSNLKGTPVAHQGVDRLHALSLAVYARAMGAKDIVVTVDGVNYDLDAYEQLTANELQRAAAPA